MVGLLQIPFAQLLTGNTVTTTLKKVQLFNFKVSGEFPRAHNMLTVEHSYG